MIKVFPISDLQKQVIKQAYDPNYNKLDYSMLDEQELYDLLFIFDDMTNNKRYQEVEKEIANRIANGEAKLFDNPPSHILDDIPEWLKHFPFTLLWKQNKSGGVVKRGK